jgi:hypothetical protein
MMIRTIIFLALSLGSIPVLAETRDPWLWPYSVDSIWSQPIGSEAAYVPANLDIGDGIAIDTEILLRIGPDAPLRPLFAPLSWEARSGGTIHLPPVRINDEDTVPDATKWWTPNYCEALLMPDNRTVRHLAPIPSIPPKVSIPIIRKLGSRSWKDKGSVPKKDGPAWYSSATR